MNKDKLKRKASERGFIFTFSYFLNSAIIDLQYYISFKCTA